MTGQVCFGGTCCTPDCLGKTCGPDGRGASCGPCIADSTETGWTDLERCVGGRCVTWRGDCPAGANVTGNRKFCRCYQSFAGDTRCGRASDGAGPCGECDGDEDCYGDGRFCAVDGPPCPCEDGQARCIQSS